MLFRERRDAAETRLVVLSRASVDGVCKVTAPLWALSSQSSLLYASPARTAGRGVASCRMGGEMENGDSRFLAARARVCLWRVARCSDLCASVCVRMSICTLSDFEKLPKRIGHETEGEAGAGVPSRVHDEA